MKKSVLPHLLCPSCRSPALQTLGAEEIEEGVLRCSQCGSEVRVRGSVPRFVPDDGYADSFGFQWNRFRKTQLDSYTGLSLSSDRLFLATGWPRELEGQRVLEGGSGAGRFTEVLLATGATVFSFDLSSAVDANQANNGSSPRLHLFQASIYEIPLPKRSIDKLICLGVLQHTPDPERSFRELVSFVKPGGALVVDVYARNLKAMIGWKYLLRPITRRLPKRALFRLVQGAVAVLLRPAITARRCFGRAGARLFPILEYSHLGLPLELNRAWAVLDTFDMYSPAHDHPQTLAEMRRWCEECGLEDIQVEYGPNGVIARARVPAGG
jgi:2-polyprenyl-3-methyl-5-hydroxy-6-metoxy-1,4-benzoquinol methylase